MDYGHYFTNPIEPATTFAAAEACGAMFTPSKAPVTLPDGTVPAIGSGVNRGRPALEMVYRELPDGSQFLLNAGVSPSYYSQGYQSVIATAEAMFPNSCVGMNLHENGRKLTFVQNLDGEAHDFGDGDSLTNYLMFTASLDSTWPSAVHGFAHRPMCSNAIPYSGGALLRQRRTRNHDELMAYKVKIMLESDSRFRTFLRDVDVLRNFSVTDKQYDKIMKDVFPPPEEDASQHAKTRYDNRVAEIKTFWNTEKDRVGDTGWALYNAVQTYEYHRQTRDRDTGVSDLKKDRHLVESKDKYSSAVRDRVLALAA